VHAHIKASIVSAPQSVQALPAPVRAGIVQSFVHALHAVFTVGVPVAAVAFLLAILLPDLPLRREAHIGGVEPEVAAPQVEPSDLEKLDGDLVVPEGVASRT
jgi:hypothetical protein